MSVVPLGPGISGAPGTPCSPCGPRAPRRAAIVDRERSRNMRVLFLTSFDRIVLSLMFALVTSDAAVALAVPTSSPVAMIAMSVLIARPPWWLVEAAGSTRSHPQPQSARPRRHQAGVVEQAGGLVLGTRGAGGRTGRA